MGVALGINLEIALWITLRIALKITLNVSPRVTLGISAAGLIHLSFNALDLVRKDIVLTQIACFETELDSLLI